MTTAIAQFMRELERAWDAHRDALLVRRDLAAALGPLAAEPSIVHIPAMTGAAGHPALERFYADQFLLAEQPAAWRDELAGLHRSPGARCVRRDPGRAGQ